MATAYLNEKIKIKNNQITKSYIRARVNPQTPITKSGTYGFVDIPLSQVLFSNGSDFELSNNRIYYRGEGTATILIAGCLVISEPDVYILTGSVNGGYNFIGGVVSNTLAGYSGVVNTIMRINKDQYVTFGVGKNTAFTATVYQETSLAVYRID